MFLLNELYDTFTNAFAEQNAFTSDKEGIKLKLNYQYNKMNNGDGSRRKLVPSYALIKIKTCFVSY